MRDARPYFSKTRKPYGFKTGASVLPNNIHISLAKHWKEDDSDISIFQCCVSKHKLLGRKNDEDDLTADVGNEAIH